MTLPLAFLTVAAVVIVTPGPDTALTIRNTLLGGRIGGVATALGIAFGQSVWALATSLGVGALLVASELLFLSVKYAGAAYLVWLGLQSLLAAARPTEQPSNPAATARPLTGLPPHVAFRQGTISNLGNPKMVVFFASLLPQFVPGHEAGVAALLWLGLVFAAMTLGWLSLYAVLVARLGPLLGRLPVRRAIEAVTGAALIALGLRVAAEQR